MFGFLGCYPICCSISQVLHSSCEEGSPHSLHVLKFSFVGICSMAGRSRSMVRDMANFVPVCFSSILFSMVRMSLRNASEAYGQGVSWKGIFFM